MVNESKVLIQQKPDYKQEVIDISKPRQSTANIVRVTLGNYLTYLTSGSVFIPEAQRGNVWTPVSKTAYMSSLVRRDATDDIVLNDIKSSMHMEPSAENYYKQLNEHGYSYELCDGSNRSSDIVAFFNGSVRLAEDTPALNLDGFIYQLKGKTWSDILNDKKTTPEQKNMIDSFFKSAISVTLKILTDMTSAEVCEYMINLNKNEPWKPQNFRMVPDTSVNRMIRAMMKDEEITAFTNYDYNTRMGTRSRYTKDYEVSFLYTVLSYFIMTNNVHHSILMNTVAFDTFHKYTVLTPEDELHVTSRVREVMKVVNTFSTDLIVTDALVLDIYMTIDALRVEGYTIDSFKVFGKYFLARDKFRKQHTRKVATTGKTAYEMLMRNSRTPKSLVSRYTIILNNVMEDIADGMEIGVSQTGKAGTHNVDNIEVFSTGDTKMFYTNGFKFDPSDTTEADNTGYVKDDQDDVM